MGGTLLGSLTRVTPLSGAGRAHSWCPSPASTAPAQHLAGRSRHVGAGPGLRDPDTCSLCKEGDEQRGLCLSGPVSTLSWGSTVCLWGLEALSEGAFCVCCGSLLRGNAMTTGSATGDPGSHPSSAAPCDFQHTLQRVCKGHPVPLGGSLRWGVWVVSTWIAFQ